MDLEPHELESLFAPFNFPDVPGASMVVIRQGEIVMSRAFGLANLETQTPCTLQTNYRLASVSKQFTAMVILMLVEQGELKLQDSISQFFPELTSLAQDMTVHHLLNHTSGLPDYESLIPSSRTAQLHDGEVPELLKRGERYFAPGSQFRYSNTGYVLLGLVASEIVGKPLQEVLRELIFAPLKMHSTVAHVSGVNEVPHRAYGYTQCESGFELTDQSLTSATLGDGGIYSSVLDLVKWDQALSIEQLVSRAALEKMFTPSAQVEDGLGYGYGWFIRQEAGATTAYHTGETVGFRNAIERSLTHQTTAIVLSNRYNEVVPWIAQGLRQQGRTGAGEQG